MRRDSTDGLPQIGIALAVALGTAAVFSRALTCAFVNFDDTLYVTQNTTVQRGLTLETAEWAWTAVVGAQRYPLTLLSHLLDVSLFGMNPAGHHATSVLIHAANAGLLYLALERPTRRRGAAAVVALLFALHPLRVESVAWVAERKDVLSGFFWMLSMLAYARYAARPGVVRYAGVVGAAAAGLLCKPMVVTLPCVLLLLDVWPLGRFREPRTARQAAWLMAEKIPLFGLSLVAAVATWMTQSRGGAVAGLDVTPLAERVLNAIGSYWVYVAQTLIPLRLAVFYPMPATAWLYTNAALGTALLICGSVAAYRLRLRVPAFGVGWLWYLVTLAPVIGFVQVGAQAHADRYTYLPSVGLSIAGVWYAGEKHWLDPKLARDLAVSTICCVLAVTTWIQIGHWRSSETLFGHALRATANNARAEDFYGLALLERGNTPGAIAHFTRSSELEPGNPQPRHNLAMALADSGNATAAEAVARDTLATFPDHVGSLYFLGSRALTAGRIEEALPFLEKAARRAPGRADVWVNLGICYGRIGRARESEAAFRSALDADSRYAPAYLNLGVLALESGDRDTAAQFFDRALEVKPDYAPARAAKESLGRDIR